MKPPVTTIELGFEESSILDDLGADAFAIITRARHPRDPKRWVLHLVPIEWQTARHADAVLHGRKKAMKIKATSKS